MNLVELEDTVHQIEKDVQDFYGSLELAREYESGVKREMKRLTKITRVNLAIGGLLIIILICKTPK